MKAPFRFLPRGTWELKKSSFSEKHLEYVHFHFWVIEVSLVSASYLRVERCLGGLAEVQLQAKRGSFLWRSGCTTSGHFCDAALARIFHSRNHPEVSIQLDKIPPTRRIQSWQLMGFQELRWCVRLEAVLRKQGCNSTWHRAACLCGCLPVPFKDQRHNLVSFHFTQPGRYAELDNQMKWNDTQQMWPLQHLTWWRWIGGRGCYQHWSPRQHIRRIVKTRTQLYQMDGSVILQIVLQQHMHKPAK